ncbi:HPr(Ser) kinase/phosphatase [Candidatus Poribacteria bacterium]|nr:HPr(Ser) kinase/phosphatase [Candidatus Poribacteria bacterium]
MSDQITLLQLFRQLEYDLKLKLVAGAAGLDQKIVAVAEVNRPGLALYGDFDSFANDRIQVMGAGEIQRAFKMTQDERREIFHKMISYQVPCFVVTRGLDIPEELIDECNNSQTPVFSSILSTPAFVGRLVPRLEDEFGPSTVVHGDFIEAFGVGVLIMGESGVGKSECALDLIRRGHRLIADDAVLLKCVTGHRILGSSPYSFGHYMEVRGVGIIDVSTLFGITAVRSKKSVDMVVTLEQWDEDKSYNRSGLEEEFYEIFEEKLPHVTIPIQPGRSTSIIVEVAAMNHRARKMGHHSAEELNKAIIRHMKAEAMGRDLSCSELDD